MESPAFLIVVCIGIVCVALLSVALISFSHSYRTRSLSTDMNIGSEYDMLIRPKYFHELPHNAHLDARYGRQVSSTEQTQTLRELLAWFTEHSEGIGIRPILMFGGLIGHYFNNKLLPWDDDIDMVLLEPDNHKLKRYETDDMLLDVNPAGTSFNRQDKGNTISARVISKANGSFIDIVYFRRIGDNYECKDGNVFTVAQLLPLKREVFENHDIWVPADTKSCIVRRYGLNVLKPVYNGWTFKGGAWQRD